MVILVLQFAVHPNFQAKLERLGISSGAKLVRRMNQAQTLQDLVVYRLSRPTKQLPFEIIEERFLQLRALGLDLDAAVNFNGGNIRSLYAWYCFSSDEYKARQYSNLIKYLKLNVEKIGIPEGVPLVFRREEVKNLKQQYGYWLFECWNRHREPRFCELSSLISSSIKEIKNFNMSLDTELVVAEKDAGEDKEKLNLLLIVNRYIKSLEEFKKKGPEANLLKSEKEVKNLVYEKILDKE